jgi:glyoxylase-like metal-dependent hydrolase (beta-lactamase superfamily II)
VLIEALPQLYVLRIAAVNDLNVYLWCDGDEVTVIDCGLAGTDAQIAAGLAELGLGQGNVARVVVTHGHEDHCGAAAALAAWGAEVLVHADDAAIVRGERPKPDPVLRDWERPIFDAVPSLPAPPAVHVDRELRDGDAIEFGGGARVIGTPGHTAGSIAIHLPSHGVLFTGDTLANVDGHTIPGVFNVDSEAVGGHVERFRAHDAELLCVGHGDILVGVALTRWRTD